MLIWENDAVRAFAALLGSAAYVTLLYSCITPESPLNRFVRRAFQRVAQTLERIIRHGPQ